MEEILGSEHGYVDHSFIYSLFFSLRWVAVFAFTTFPTCPAICQARRRFHGTERPPWRRAIESGI
jgi:hypothetical protein